MKIIEYNDARHRDQVIDLWKLVFGYPDRRNDPALVIDKKLASDDALFFVAITGNTVAGAVMAGYDGHRGWIYSLAVHPSKRNLKVGTALLHCAEGALRRKGCVKINLQILETNGGVRAFYERNGYRVEPRISMGKELPENI